MTRLLQPLFALLASTTDSKLRQVAEYLKEENRILRDKLPTRITVTPAERARLTKLGTALGGAIKTVITIVSPRTFARWVAGAGKDRHQVPARKSGRPRTAEDIRKLIIEIANDTGWGSLRVTDRTEETRHPQRQPSHRRQHPPRSRNRSRTQTRRRNLERLYQATRRNPVGL